MGVLRPLVKRGMDINKSENVEPSNKLLTAPNLMTISRPLLALKTARLLLQGKRGATGWMFATGISDAEGSVARLTNSVSDFGVEADPIADSMAIMIIGAAVLKAPRLTKIGKLATSIALGHEVFKSVWALNKNHQYHQATGERLIMPPSIDGKESMARKFSAVGLAIFASEFDNFILRQAISIAALGFAACGALQAEEQRHIYDETANQLIENSKLS